jgi:hypothetical protein
VHQTNAKDRASHHFNIVVVEGSRNDIRKVDSLQKQKPRLGLVVVAQKT